MHLYRALSETEDLIILADEFKKMKEVEVLVYEESTAHFDEGSIRSSGIIVWTEKGNLVLFWIELLVSKLVESHLN